MENAHKNIAIKHPMDYNNFSVNSPAKDMRAIGRIAKTAILHGLWLV